MRVIINIPFVICAALSLVGIIGGIYAGRFDSMIIGAICAHIAAGFRNSDKELKEGKQ